MTQPSEKLAIFLERLRELQEDGRRIFRSDDFSREQREVLLETGWLHQVIKGWLMSASPETDPVDTTPWYASFWEFCARYCTHRFGDQWHLSPRHSLLLRTGDSHIPEQVIVHAPEAHNNLLELPFDTSLYLLKDDAEFPVEDVAIIEGVQVLKYEPALIRVSGSFFTQDRIAAEVALSQVDDTSELLRRLLEDGRTVVAGRLSEALRHVGKTRQAEEIEGAMEDAGYRVRRSNPFDPNGAPIVAGSTEPPIVARVQGLWCSSRDAVLSEMPASPGIPKDHDAYLESVEGLYERDAYHSLSIEGYRVTGKLVDRVKTGDWDPENRVTDRDDVDAMAARGYWEAFQEVKEAIRRILAGDDPTLVVEDAHNSWYRKLFRPFVRAGIVERARLAGYRSGPVFVRGTRHVPPRAEVVPNAMKSFFTLLKEEPEPAVRAVLGHWLLGYVHPYPDGNGRIARFLMNAMLASGGYPWTVIRVDDRTTYMNALDAASVDGNLQPFSRFVAERVGWSREQDLADT